MEIWKHRNIITNNIIKSKGKNSIKKAVSPA